MCIVALDDFTDYAATDSVYEAAQAIYREYDLGWGREYYCITREAAECAAADNK